PPPVHGKRGGRIPSRPAPWRTTGPRARTSRRQGAPAGVPHGSRWRLLSVPGTHLGHGGLVVLAAMRGSGALRRLAGEGEPIHGRLPARVLLEATGEDGCHGAAPVAVAVADLPCPVPRSGSGHGRSRPRPRPRPRICSR